MYSIYCDSVCLYDDTYSDIDMQVEDPELIMEDNSAGSLTFKLRDFNNGSDIATRYLSDISVYRNNDEIWFGRIKSETDDFQNCRDIYCEGALAFLNDTVQSQKKFSKESCTLSTFLDGILSEHNQKVKRNRQIWLGVVNVEGMDAKKERYTNYESTINLINALVDEFSAHVRLRKEAGLIKLDFLSDKAIFSKSYQPVNFGENLLDFTKSYNLSDIATVILPLGKVMTENANANSEEPEKYLTVENGDDGIYVKGSQLTTVGWLERVVHWDEIESPNELLTLAKKYLETTQFERMSMDVSAVDLHYLNPDIKPIDLYDVLLGNSTPHGMINAELPVTKMVIPLSNPINSTYTLGASKRQSFTGMYVNTARTRVQTITKIKEQKISYSEVSNTSGGLTVTIGG